MNFPLTRSEQKIIATLLSQDKILTYSDLKSLLNDLNSTLLATLSSLCRKDILNPSLQTTIQCKECKYPLAYIESFNSLFCNKCNYTIELDEENSLEYSSFKINEKVFIKIIQDFLLQENISVNTVESLNDFNFPKMKVGGLISVFNFDFHMIIAINPLDKEDLFSLIGYALLEDIVVILIYASPKEPISTAFFLTSRSAQILPLEINKLFQNTFVDSIRHFVRYFNFISDYSKQIEEIVDQKLLNTIPIVKEVSVTTNEIIKMSQFGREKFEPITIQLLNIFGPSRRFRKKEYLPDGLLMLPEGFWIIDAKSSKKPFEFKVDERDKMRRYIELIEEKYVTQKHWKFYGEILVTRTIPNDNFKDLRLLSEYVNKYLINSWVTILPIEPLADLYVRIWKNPEFFHRYNPKEHPLLLLTGLKPNFLPSDYHDNPILSKILDRRVHYITPSLFERFYDDVMSSPYPLMQGRRPESLIDEISWMTERGFMT